MDPGISTLVGAIVGGGVTYITQRSVDRRRWDSEAGQTVIRLYDAAITAVAGLKAQRWNGATKIDTSVFPTATEEQRAELIRKLDAAGIERFISARQEARVALAAVQPYCSQDLQGYWDKPEPVAEGEYDRLMAILVEQRKVALARATVKVRVRALQMGLTTWDSVRDD